MHTHTHKKNNFVFNKVKQQQLLNTFSYLSLKNEISHKMDISQKQENFITFEDVK